MINEMINPEVVNLLAKVLRRAYRRGVQLQLDNQTHAVVPSIQGRASGTLTSTAILAGHQLCGDGEELSEGD